VKFRNLHFLKNLAKQLEEYHQREPASRFSPKSPAKQKTKTKNKNNVKITNSFNTILQQQSEKN